MAGVPTAWTTFSSTRFAYSIDYPSDWVATPATQDWHGIPYPDSPALDTFALTPTSPRVFAASDAVNASYGAADWIAELDGDNAGICELSDRHVITIDGVTARQEDFLCFKQDYGIEVVVANESRFYQIDLFSSAPFDEADRATFDQFLASFRFGDL